MQRSSKRMLLATDGSEDAKLAARAAADLAKRLGAGLYVAHAWYPVQPGYPTIAGADYYYMYEREGRRMLETSVDEIEALDGIDVEPRLLQGTPIDAILDLSEEIQPDLVIMGSRGLGAFGRLLVGSVSEGVVHHARFPVLVVRGGQEAWPPEAVIAGDDGSGSAEGAADLAASIGTLFRAGITLVRAYRYPPEPIGGWSAEDRQRLDERRTCEENALAKRAESLGQELGNGVTARVVEGEPAAAILGAGKGPRSLFAVGSRGLGAISRARFGSVSSKILRAANGPVLVYPHAGDGSAWASAGEAAAMGRRRTGAPSWPQRRSRRRG